jgi:hypothetical protein
LQVCQHCPNTIAEFYNYLMDEGKDKPIDANNHALDALRYVVMREDGRGHSGFLMVP